jgi:hypothetical protein
MALKELIDREVRKVEKEAQAAAVALGFRQGKGLIEAVCFEFENSYVATKCAAGRSRARCIEALVHLLEVDTDARDWPREVDRLLAILKRDVVKAAPPPNIQVLISHALDG